jgi:hypothetical protein
MRMHADPDPRHWFLDTYRLAEAVSTVPRGEEGATAPVHSPSTSVRRLRVPITKRACPTEQKLWRYNGIRSGFKFETLKNKYLKKETPEKKP